MKVVEPNVELIAYSQLPPERFGSELNPHLKYVSADPCSEMARIVERCGRVSWKSEDKSGPGTADGFCTRVVNIKKDESIAEHVSVTMLFTMDRYASHQLVRHRIAAYTQESTHYINYGKEKFGKEISVCRPRGIAEGSAEYHVWHGAMLDCEAAYLKILDAGVKHYHARFALPGCLKTELIATYNARMWRHVIAQRIQPNNTPEIVFVMKKAAKIMAGLMPEMFAEYSNLGD